MPPDRRADGAPQFAVTAARSSKSEEIEKIETALESKFQEHFVNAMAMPNKVDAFPKLAEVVTLPARKH